MSKFSLTERFLDEYQDKKPPFGFNGLGELVYRRTYSRKKQDGTKEVWWETVKRVVEGIYNIQKEWIDDNGLEWNPWKAQSSAQEMYDRMFNMKFLPPGRGLWAVGSPITTDRNLYLALYNCAMNSTEDIDIDATKPFCFMMDALMCGVGVGFDVLGAGKITISAPEAETDVFVIPDSREGWVESLDRLLDSYFHAGRNTVEFDYSEIRPSGEPIKGFGGISSGAGPLKDLHQRVRKILSTGVGKEITITQITDIMNLIGRTVVAGNIRRCLPEGTLVHTKKGLIPIESVETGMMVKTSTGYYEVTEAMSQGKQPVWEIETVMGTLRATARHKVAVSTEGHSYSWKLVSDLDLKDRLVFVAGGGDTIPTQILSITPEVEVVNTYDLTVAEVSEFVVQEGLLVHNSAQLAVGPNSEEYLDLKNYDVNPNRVEFGWASNNSIAAELGMDYTDAAYRTAINGEPGYIWLENARKYGRMIDSPDYKDMDIVGFNPCGEIALGNMETCVSGDTRVLTRSGYPKIQSVVDTPIEVWNGEEWSEVTPRKTSDAETLYRVSLLDGSHLDVTSTHKWRAKTEDGIFQQYTTADLRRRMVVEGFRVRGESGGVEVPNAFEYGKEVGTNKPDHLPESIFMWDTESLKYFLAGWVEADGTSQLSNERLYYSVYGNEGLLRDTQLLLRKMGINNGFLCRMSESSWVLDATLYEFDSQIGLDDLDQRILSVEELPGKHHTYCFTEPKRHMAVFGNCLTYQCNLSETFPNKHETVEDYLRTLKYAYLYAKTVTLKPTHWPETNRAMLRNRRLGVSMSGIAQFLSDKGLGRLKEYAERGYDELKRLDEVYSNWLCVPRSRRLSTSKPSGSVSLLCGATPGIHFPEARFYIRRVRISKNSDLLMGLKNAGYTLEEATDDPEHTMVVEVPIDVGEGVKTLDQSNIWEQLGITAFIQKYWSDNGVSSTVTFREEERDQIEDALNIYQYQLKAVSFLPKLEGGAYKQMPYEAITEERYKKIISKLKTLELDDHGDDAKPELYCDSDGCVI